MRKRGLPLLALLLLTLRLPAQEPPHADELRFVNQLRNRGDNALALEYLDRLKQRNPSPELAKLLPLEVVKTRLALADTEQDEDRKIALFDQARQELEGFIKANPMVSDARMQLARIGQFQGRAQLDRALALSEDDEGRQAEIGKARKLLSEANTAMQGSIKDIKDEDAQAEASFDRCLLLLDLARSYTRQGVQEEDKARGALLAEATSELEKVASNFPRNNPARWQALTWSARAYDMNAQPDEAKKKYTQVLASGDANVIRQARYFQVLGEHERLLDKGDRKPAECQAIITAANAWLTANPRFHTTPEGLGARWIVARQSYELGRLSPPQKDIAWNNARVECRKIEETPSEYASKAQTLKIRILTEQNAFAKAIDTLVAWDDLYMRALYEHQRLMKDKTFEDADKRKEQQKTVIKILEKALARSKAPGVKVTPNEMGTAMYLLSGYYYSTGAYKEAAKAGEEYARANLRSPQASIALVYAAQSLSTLLEQRAGEPEEALKADRDRLFKMAELLIDRWPGEPAGDFGRQLATLHLIRTGEDEKALKLGGDHARFQIGLKRFADAKHEEAIEQLSKIQPTFTYYTQSQFRLGLAALQCERDAQEADGKRKWQQVAIEAFRKVPTPADNADPLTNIVYMESKKTLAGQLYSQGKFDDMDAVCKDALARLDSLDFDPNEDKSQELRKAYKDSLETLQLYSIYGRADTLQGKKQFADACKLLDPVVDGVKDKKYTSLKGAPSLRSGLFSLCLRCNIQQSKIQRATDVLDVWTSQTAEDEREKELMAILQQIVVLMNQQVKALTEAKDKAGLDSTRASFAAFLSALQKRQTKPSLDFSRTMAMGFATLGRHDEAADILAKLPEPKKELKTPDDTEKRLRAAFVLRIRQLRLGATADPEKGADKLKQANDMMADILKDWGRSDLNARIEEVYLLQANKDYGAAYVKGTEFLRQLQPLAEKNPQLHNAYFEAYLVMCENRYRYAVEKAQGQDRETVRKHAAQLIKDRLDGKINPELTPEARERLEALLKEVEGTK